MFEKVLVSSMATSEERLEQSRRVRCRATRRMGHSNRIYNSSERLDSSTAVILQKHRAREEPSKLRAADYVERKDHAKRDGEVLVEAFKARRSMKVMDVNLQEQYKNIMRCDKPSLTNLVNSTEVPL